MCLALNRIRHPTQKGVWIDVECGKCFECIRKRKMLWQVRILSEMSVSDCTFFSLISYNEENLPDPMVYDKPALQLLVKRMRIQLKRMYGDDVKLKYFIVSEYGEQRNRLHYHSIWFLKGVEMDRYQWKVFLESEWGKGFCSAYNLDNTWASYACKYIQKSYNMLMASRLGKEAYLKYNGRDFYPNMERMDFPSYPIKGKIFPIPRSWREFIKPHIPGSKLPYNPEYYVIAGNYHKNHPKEKRLSYNDRLLIQDKFQSDNPELYLKDKFKTHGK